MMTSAPGMVPLSTTPGARSILAAATTLFAAEGYDAVSVASIAERAGICKANVFHHFPSKEDLYVAVMTEATAAHADYAEQLCKATDTCANKVRRLIDFDINYMLVNRERTRLVLRECADSGNDRVCTLARAVFRRNFAAVMAIFEQGRALGEFAESTDAEAAAMLLCGVTQFFFNCREALREISGTASLETPAVYAERMAELILLGIARRPPGGVDQQTMDNEGITMNTKAAKFDQTYLDQKRRQLLELRESLSGVRQSQAAEEGTVNEQARSDAHEFEEDAQKLATLEVEGTLVARADARLADVERALRKIDEGTYGLSDESGKAIPSERLDAKPEALYTIEEQEALDAKA